MKIGKIVTLAKAACLPRLTISPTSEDLDFSPSFVSPLSKAATLSVSTAVYPPRKYWRSTVRESAISAFSSLRAAIAESSCILPINGPPTIPTVSIPIPAIAFSVRAPPLGHCSETTPNIVGQKNVFPIPYNVAKINIAAIPEADESINKPTIANAADAINNPIGVNALTIGPAKKNLSTIMMPDV